eukprot:7072139-Pyramimonas_sp.AAC.1
MVSASFVAELGSHPRSRMSAAGDTTVGGGGVDRPFGGAHASFCGESYQPEPTSGAAINAVPTSYLKKARKHAHDATEGHGQHIFWGARGEGTAQGMTELTERMRVEGPDEWFRGMQKEFRRGALTERARNFLHGRLTDAP